MAVLFPLFIPTQLISAPLRSYQGLVVGGAA
jgi:hypothetical protein